jgi:hypothetical protein
MSQEKPTLEYQSPPPVALSGTRMVWQCFFACVTTVVGFSMAVAVCLGIGDTAGAVIGIV